MPQDHIRYDILAQDALRGVIRKVLSEVAATGHLPGDHHFFITFMTSAQGVRLSPQLRQRYPDQMTIVIQHQYWDLKVNEASFEIGLSFSDVPEKLVIPFAAIRGFYDPAVNFELEFDPSVAVESKAPEDADARRASPPRKADDVKRSAKRAEKPKAQQPAEAAKLSSQTDTKSGADVVSLDSFRKKS